MSAVLPNRRQVLKTLGLSAGVSMLQTSAAAMDYSSKPGSPFKYSLNMSTIRGQQLGFVKELQTAAKAGFSSVEIWIDSFRTYLENGGSIKEAKNHISGLGLTIENAIGFAKWIVDDETDRKAGLLQLQEEMQLLAEIGCRRIAAPPMGATALPLINLDEIAIRYLKVLELGKKHGIKPILEMWGGSKNLQKISHILYVAAACGYKDAALLIDTFHIYKGGSSIESIPLVGRPAIEIFHINDYPAGIAPEKISEPDRIYPGDGIAPLKQTLSYLKNPERPVILSLEVFNESYYKQDALLVAKTGLAKMKSVAEGI